MEGWVPGATLQLRLKEAGAESADIQGEIFSYDNSTDILVLQEVKADGKRDIRILRGQNVKSHTITSRRELSPEEQTLPPVSMDRVRAREESALIAAQTEADKYGNGVTAEAQDIFFALSKTLPCRWEGDVILVDDIRISKPYTPQLCKGGTPQSLPRVQKILEAARKRAESGKK